METDDEEQLQWKGGGQFSKRKEGRSTSFETDTRPSNSGGPISRQSCYYASFSPPHGTSELMADKEDEGGGKKKAFCSSVCERERERCSFVPHTHGGFIWCQRVLELKRILFPCIPLVVCAYTANSSISNAKINTDKHKQGHEVRSSKTPLP